MHYSTCSSIKFVTFLLKLLIPMLPLSVRLYSILALASYVLLGLPAWWQLTRIHRPPLPHVQMQSINTSFYLPIELNLVLPTNLDETYRSTLSTLLLDQLHLLGLKRITIAATSYEDPLVSSLASMSDDQVDKTLLRHVNEREEGRHRAVSRRELSSQLCRYQPRTLL